MLDYQSKRRAWASWLQRHFIKSRAGGVLWDHQLVLLSVLRRTWKDSRTKEKGAVGPYSALGALRMLLFSQLSEVCIITFICGWRNLDSESWRASPQVAWSSRAGRPHWACSAPTGTRRAEKALGGAPPAHVRCMLRLAARHRAGSKTSVSRPGPVFAEELPVFQRRNHKESLEIICLPAFFYQGS